MNKRTQAPKLAQLLLTAAKEHTIPSGLDRNWEEQVMERVLEQNSPSGGSIARCQSKTGLQNFFPTLSAMGTLAAGLTLIACNKLDAIDAHMLKATVDSTFSFSAGLFTNLL